MRLNIMLHAEDLSSFCSRLDIDKSDRLCRVSLFQAPINHILTASVMSAPAALAIAKLLYPDERKPTVKAEDAYNVDAGWVHG